jgi:hypothetical protein
MGCALERCSATGMSRDKPHLRYLAVSIIHQTTFYVARHWPFHRCSAIIILNVDASQSYRYATVAKRLQTQDLEADAFTSSFIDSLLSSEVKKIQVSQLSRGLVSGTT